MRISKHFAFALLTIASFIQAVQCAAQTGCVPAPAGLVGWWKGDGNPNDSASTNNGTTPFGISYTNGVVGQAFRFTASGTRVSIPDNPAFILTNSLTIEGWINIAGDGGVVFWRGDNRVGLDPYFLTMGSSGHIDFYIESATTAVGLEAPITYSQWHHVAATLEDSTGAMSIYIDGALIAQTNTTVRPLGALDPTRDPTLGIGNVGETVNDFSFNGLIDEISLYSRALSQSEIQSIYNAGSAGKCFAGTAPSITSQPTNQTVAAGQPANFSVTATGTPPLLYQWFHGTALLNGATQSTYSIASVQSGDMGTYSVIVSNSYGFVPSSNATLVVTPPSSNCVPAPAGLVGWWKGDGNANDSAGTNNGTTPFGISYTNGLVGQAFRFTASGTRVSIPDNPAFILTNSLSIEGWIKIAGDGGVIFWRGDNRVGLDPYFLTMGSSGRIAFYIVSETTTVSLDAPITYSQWHHVAATLEDSTGAMSIYIDGALVAQKSTTVRPLGPLIASAQASLGIGNVGETSNDFSFNGLIDEISLYSRALSLSEIQSIYNAGSAGKCVVPQAPFIITQPASQAVTAGSTANFNVVAGGTPPLTYQWTFDGSNIDGATSSALVLGNVQHSQAGTYAVVVSNSVNSVTSSNAVLTVNYPPATVRVTSETNMGGATFTVPVLLVANGNENALGFSLSFDPSRLTFSSVTLGPDSGDGSLLVNYSQSSSGAVGIGLSLATGETFPPGTLDLVDVTFTAAVVTSNLSTSVSFSSSPAAQQLADVNGNPLPANFVPGTIALIAPDLEGDVTPRPTGDHAVTISDWVMVGRFAARLDYPTNASEFQRADCAPRATLGNGEITVSDWVQAGRYAVGLDPLTPAGGPTNENPPGPTLRIASGSSGPTPHPLSTRQVQVSNATLNAGQSGAISINLLAQGNENALGFSLSFDPASFSYSGLALGHNAAGATLDVNASQAASGIVACVVGLGTGTSFAAGTNELLKLTLQPKTTASGSYQVVLSDLPVLRETADATANTLTTTYVNGTITVNGLPPLLSIGVNGGNVMLSWPVTATGFVLQENANGLLPTSSVWSNVSVTPTTNNGQNSVTLTVGNGPKFYRLYKQ